VLNTIQELLTKDEIPIVEDGSGFCLIIYSSNGFKFDYQKWNQAVEEPRDIVNRNSNWLKCVDHLKKICQSYDDAI